MKINFTKKEYEVLIKALYLADWVLNAHGRERETENELFKQLEQKVLSFSKDFGLEELVEYEAKYDEYLHTQEFDNSIMPYIKEFEDDNFWEELIHRLSVRDLIRKYPMEQFRVIDLDEEKLKEFFKLEEKYSEEFEINGLENVQIKK